MLLFLPPSSCQSWSTDSPSAFDGFTFHISLFHISWNLFCCVVWSENLTWGFFFPDSEPIFPTPLFNNSSLPPWFVKAHIFWVTKTGNSQWHYATKITCFQELESTHGYARGYLCSYPLRGARACHCRPHRWRAHFSQNVLICWTTQVFNFSVQFSSIQLT